MPGLSVSPIDTTLFAKANCAVPASDGPMLNRSSLTPIYPASLSNCAADSHSRRACRYQHRRKRCRIFAPSAPPKLAVGAGQDIKKGERSNAQVDCRCLRSDLGVISTGFATRIPPAARQTGHSNPRSMRRRFAPREWRLRENSRPPCRQQVRPRSNLLATEPAPRAPADRQSVGAHSLKESPAGGGAKRLGPVGPHLSSFADSDVLIKTVRAVHSVQFFIITRAPCRSVIFSLGFAATAAVE